ncbi:MAG: dihydroorotase [Lachnospiraceae bacterium]|nr:dihydroorotase [Lachnospiraceae bacterium]
MLRIKNALIANPDSEEFKGFVEIEDGVITHVGPAPSKRPADREIDADKMIAMPGFCDVHVHFRDPGFTHKEDIITGAKCATRGGFTDVVLMANTNPVTDNTETLEYVLNKGKTTPIHVHACAAVTKGLKGMVLTDMEALKAAGAAGFTDDGIPLMDEALLKTAFEKAAALNVPVSLHEEDKRLIKENGINHGKASEHYGIYGSPREAEASLIERDIEIALKTGVKMDVQHISTKEGVELVRKAREKSKDICAEVTPHHLSLTEDAVIEFGANAKMNPPLRTEEDRQAIIEGIKDGTISMIATDHAPHAPEEKAGDILKAPSGILGLETSFVIAYNELVRSRVIALPKLVSMFTKNPREFYGFSSENIKEGAPADITIFAPEEDFLYDKSVSKSVNSPFLGKTFKGKIKYTICGGKTVYEDL